MSKKIVHEKKLFIKFCIIGGCSTLIDYILYRVILSYGMQMVLAKSISMSIAMLFSYTINKLWSFKEIRKKRQGELLRYAICQVINFMTNVSINLLIVKLTQNINIAFVFATGTAMLVNYLLQRYWVFGGGNEIYNNRSLL